VGRVRERFNKWVRRAAEPPVPQNPLLFTDHEEIQDIARQMARTKVEIDRSILTLRSWARDLSRRVAEMAVAQTATGITEAFHYLRQAPIVTWSLIYIALTYTLVAVAGALAPGFVREVLRVGERNVVIIVAPAGVGVIAGLGLLNAIGRRWPRPNAIGTGLIVAGSALLFLAAARPLTDLFSRVGSPGLGAAFPAFVALIAGTAFVFGVSYALITVPSMTLLQEELPDQIRGRVFGFLNMLVSIFSLIPLVVVGPIADLWGVAPVFVLAALVVFSVWFGGRAVRLKSSLQ